MLEPWEKLFAKALEQLRQGGILVKDWAFGKTVAELMGHTDASMILKTYQHVQDAQKQAAVEVFPELLT